MTHHFAELHTYQKQSGSVPVITVEDMDELFVQGDAGIAGKLGQRDTDIFGGKIYGMMGATPMMKSNVSFSDLLNTLDGSDVPTNAVIIFTSNRAVSYDKALLRRINRYWEISGVDCKAVFGYLKHYLGKNVVISDSDTEVIEKMVQTMNTKGYQMVALRECLIRAHYAVAENALSKTVVNSVGNGNVSNVTIKDEDIPFPNIKDVAYQLECYIPLSHDSIVQEEEQVSYCS